MSDGGKMPGAGLVVLVAVAVWVATIFDQLWNDAAGF